MAVLCTSLKMKKFHETALLLSNHSIQYKSQIKFTTAIAEADLVQVHKFSRTNDGNMDTIRHFGSGGSL